MNTNPTACLLIIGNEILSGRTHDKNLAYIAEKLGSIGVQLREVRVIPDIEATIVSTINAVRPLFTYIFTTGGIGPTHDDITSACVARAFDLPLIRHPQAEATLRAHYTLDAINEARLKMAEVPQGATLIANPVSAAPGFCIGNVYVMAGVPRIMQAMMDEICPTLQGGSPIRSHSFEVQAPEGDIAAALTAVQEQFASVEIGIYPLFKQGKLASTIVCRCNDEPQLKACAQAVREMCNRLKAEISEEESS